MGSRLAAGKDGGAFRLHGNGLETLLALFDDLGNPRNRPPRADAGDEDIHPAVRIVPDLFRRRFPMDLWIGRVLELLKHDRAGNRPRQLLRLAHRPAHPFPARRQDQFRAEDLQELPPFQTHGVRHGKDQTVTPGGGHKGQGDPRIAARRLDQDRSRLEQTAFFRGVDHGDADPVLYAGQGVEGFHLDDDPRPGPGGQAPQFHQGRSPHCLGNVGKYLHWCAPFGSLSSGRGLPQSLVDVFLDVLHILDADGKTDKILRYPRGFPFRSRQLLVGG